MTKVIPDLASVTPSDVSSSSFVVCLESAKANVSLFNDLVARGAGVQHPWFVLTDGQGEIKEQGRVKNKQILRRVQRYTKSFGV